MNSDYCQKSLRNPSVSLTEVTVASQSSMAGSRAMAAPRATLQPDPKESVHLRNTKS